MASKRKAYSLVLKLQAVEVAEKTLKEAGARQFGMCMIGNNELNGTLENTNLDEFELPLFGSP